MRQAGQNANVVICGAGIAGVSAAYFLSVIQGLKHIVLVDGNAPLSLTRPHSAQEDTRTLHTNVCWRTGCLLGNYKLSPGNLNSLILIYW